MKYTAGKMRFVFVFIAACALLVSDTISPGPEHPGPSRPVSAHLGTGSGAVSSVLGTDSRYPAFAAPKPAVNVALSPTTPSRFILPPSMTQKVKNLNIINTCVDLLDPRNFHEILVQQHKSVDQFCGNRAPQTVLHQTSIPHKTSAPTEQMDVEKPLPKVPNVHSSAGQSSTPLQSMPSPLTTQKLIQQHASTSLTGQQAKRLNTARTSKTAQQQTTTVRSKHQATPQKHVQTPTAAHANSPAAPKKGAWLGTLLRLVKFRSKTAKPNPVDPSKETENGSEAVDESERQEEQKTEEKVGKENKATEEEVEMEEEGEEEEEEGEEEEEPEEKKQHSSGKKQAPEKKNAYADSAETANSESTALSSETSQESMSGTPSKKKNIIKRIYTNIAGKVVKLKNYLTNWIDNRLAKRAEKKAAKKAAKERKNIEK